MASAENMPSWNWSKHVLENEGSQVFPRVELAYHIGMVFSAGTETSVHTLNFFVLAAILHPKIMEKARGEVYGVVGYE
jgi:cytochrome P450